MWSQITLTSLRPMYSCRTFVQRCSQMPNLMTSWEIDIHWTSSFLVPWTTEGRVATPITLALQRTTKQTLTLGLVFISAYIISYRHSTETHLLTCRFQYLLSTIISPYYKQTTTTTLQLVKKGGLTWIKVLLPICLPMVTSTFRLDKRRYSGVTISIHHYKQSRYADLSVRCLSVWLTVLSVCNVGALWPNGWIDQDETRHGGKSQPWPHCVRWRPSTLPPQRAQLPIFSPCLSSPNGWLDQGNSQKFHRFLNCNSTVAAETFTVYWQYPQ